MRLVGLFGISIQCVLNYVSGVDYRLKSGRLEEMREHASAQKADDNQIQAD